MIRCRKQEPKARTHELCQNSFQIGLWGAIIEGWNGNKFACILHISLLNNINFHSDRPDYAHIFGQSCLISDEAQLILEKIHDVLRLQATELLVFMISDKDRLQDSSAPNSMPLAYALKGRSLSNCELRYLINNVRNKLHEREIKVLCEIYDGQWQYTVMHNVHGNPLNMLKSLYQHLIENQQIIQSQNCGWTDDNKLSETWWCWPPPI